MTASSTAPSATHRTKSCFNMTLTTWSAGPSNGVCDSTLQSARSWGIQGHQEPSLLPHGWTDPTRGTESNIPRCDPIPWPNVVREHPSCCQANRMLGFARRNLRASTKRCKSMAYISLIRSRMEYASTIWDPCLKKDIDLLEKVQRKAARWDKRPRQS